MAENTLTARDASFLTLLARTPENFKDRAWDILGQMDVEARAAARVLLGEVAEDDVSPTARELARTARNWVRERRETA